jgi:hypothetical protein
MNLIMKFFRYALPLMLCLVSVLPVAAGQTSARQYTLPDGSIFQLKVPVSWQQEFTQELSELPPTITLRPKTGEDFAVLVTPLPPAGENSPPPNTEAIREHVQRVLDKARPQAGEQVITIRELRGTAGAGYYFSATDRAPKPGEYQFMTQGIFPVGNLIVAFTVLTNGGQQAIVDDALTMIRGAVRAKAGAGGSDHAVFRRRTETSR